ncbi:MAG: fibronectin type III domain-containing protein, partial [Bacteroidales bacterium]|nr:fibronectin type III domain-containing protein [Bacteroidales bacterium]
MKKNLQFLCIILLIVCISGFAQGQTTITIGTGTNDSYSLPINNYYKNSWSEMIYPASDITESGYITSIGFDVSAVASGYQCNTITIYMGTTANEAHSSNSDWLPMDALTEVWSATDWPLPTTTGWLTFDLDNPFLYDGNDNLVIVISKTMPNYTNGLKFRYTTGISNCCLYRRNDNDVSYADHPSGNTGTLSAQLPNLQLTFSTTTDFCHSVRNLTVSDVTSSEATFSWAAPVNVSDFVLQYKTQNEDWEDGSVVTVYPSTTTYTLTNLTPSTYYDVRVANICDNGNSAWVKRTFKTECVVPISVSETPYYEPFEGYAEYTFPDCWTLISGSGNYPSVRSSTSPHSGSGELWLTNTVDNPIVMALPQFAEDLNTLRLSFWMQPAGITSYFGRMEVGVMTDLTDTSTFTLLHSWSAVEIGSATYAYYEMDLDTMAPSSTGFIVFRRYVENGSRSWFLDDVQVMSIPDCESPREISALPHTYSADLTWEDMPGTYNIYYKKDTDADYISINNIIIMDTVYELDNLAPETTYQVFVTTVCEDGSEASSSFTVTFTTLCTPEATPYSEDFNASNTIPNCWAKYTGLVSDAFAGINPTPTTATGYNYWDFTNTRVFGEFHPKQNIYGTGCRSWLVSPAIDLSGLGDPVLTFDMALTKYNNDTPIADPTSQADDRFLVLISTDDGATWSAENATEWNNNGTGNYVYNQIPNTGEEVLISLAQYEGQTIRIAFYGESTMSGGDNDLHIDNVMVKDAPTCPKPAQLHASNITTHSAELSWTETGNATWWVVEYGLSGFTPGSETEVHVGDGHTSIVLYGLTPGTDYEFHVKADCGAGDFSDPKSATFRTADCEALTTPFTEDFENYTTSTTASTGIAPACWELVQEDVAMTDATRPQLYYTNTFAHSGNYCLKMHNRGIYAMPALSENIAMKDVKLEMYLRQANAAYQLQVGVWEEEEGTFVPVATFNNSTTDVTHVECDFSSYTGDGHRIAFRNVLGGGRTWDYSYNYIDDITLTESPLTPTALPYYTDFSEEADQNWLLRNGNCVNRWMMGTPNENTPSALFITQDGSTASYNITNPSTVMAEKAFFMPSTDFVHVEFDVQVGGDNYNDFLKVFLTPIEEMFEAGTNYNTQANASYSTNALDFSDYKSLTGNSNYPYMLNLTNGNMLHVSANMPNPDPNGTGKIVFLWRNNNYTGTQPGSVVTNFSIEEIANEDLLPPTVTTDYFYNVTTNSAECHGNVTDNGSLPVTARGVCFNTTPNPTLEDGYVVVSGSGLGEFSSQLTGLAQGSTYYVRAYATNLIGTSYGEEGSFTTDCETITLPYSDDFDSYTTDTAVATGVEPTCWTLMQEDVSMTDENRPQLINNSDYSHSGDYSLQLKYRGIYAMPELPANIAMNRLHLEMYLKQPKTYYALEVGVWEDDGTFVPVVTFNNSTTGMERVECYFSNYTGSGRRIAFHNIPVGNNIYNYSYNFIDDIVLNDIAMVPVALPYSTNFGEDADRNWLLNNGTCTNYWMMGSPDENTPSALFVTQDGSTASYNTTKGSTVMAEKAFLMPANDLVHVEFDVLVGGETGNNRYDFLKVFLTPVDETFEAGTNQNTQSNDSYSTYALDFTDYKPLSGSANYPYVLSMTNDNTLHISANMPNPAPNGRGKLVFLWRNDQTQGTQPGAVVTNFIINENTDVYPPTVTTGDISDVTANTATCGGNVTDNGGSTVTERGVCWSTSPNPTLEDAHTVNGNGLGEFVSNLTNLSLGVTYYIRAYATNGAGTGYGEEVSFSACDPITQLPYTNDFESYTESTTAATGIAPICWELVQEDVTMTDATRPQLYYKNAFAHSGDYSLLLNYRGVYAMPALSENITMKFMRLKMYLRQPNAAYRLQVGVWDDETSTFTPVATFNNSTTEVEYVECDFSNYTGNGRRIAFRNILGSGNYAYSYNYIDDIALTETAPAFSYTTENVCNSVSVHFENNSTEAENAAWDFGDGTTSEEFAPTHTYQESGTYVVTLSVNNGVCEEWLSVTQNVTVTMPETFTISIPYSDNFDSYTADTNTATGVEPSCWELVQEDVTMTDENRPQLIHNSNYTHSGDYSLQLNYRGIYAMPPLSDDLMLKHVKLEMYLKQTNSYYALEVGVWEDDGTFVPVATFNNSTTDMKHVECDFSIYEGSGRRIAFHNIPVGDNIYDYSYNFIDDLVLTESEGCELTIEMHDLYNDGWTGNKIRIHNDGTEKEVTLNSGSAATATVRVHSGHIALEWVNGKYPNDCSFTVTGPCLYYQAETVPAAGVFYEIDLDCNSNGTPAIPAFTWWTENTCNSVLVHFVNESSDAEFADWDFGDGDWSNEYAPVHEYTSDGTYPVMLSVNNSTCVNVINETNLVTVTMPEPLEGETTEFTICYGEFPQFWYDQVINDAGIYTTVIEATNGCDSIVTCSVSVTNPITIPYSEDFESYTESSTAATGIEPTCWNLVQQDVQMPDNKRPQLYYRSDFAHSGDYSLLLNYRGIYAMPPLEENMAMKHVHLDMYLRQPNAAYQLEVGVWDDETETFEPIATFNNSTTGVEHVECDFSNYTGNGRHIAFHNVLGSGNYAYSYNYIDDIVLTESEGCATLSFEMHDAHGDGWNGNTIRVYNDGIMKDVTLEDGADGTVTMQVYNGPIELEWIYGNWPEECTFSVTGPCFYYSGGASEDGVFFSKEIDCNSNSTPAVPAFSYWMESTCNSTLVHFENGSSDAEVASWNFDDGTISDTYSPTHEYLSSGTYLVELYVYNSECDDWNSVVQYVEVTVPESITHTFDTTVCANQLPLIWHGHEIAKEGVFTNVSVAANGCDSTVILTLNVSDLTAYTTGAIYYTQPASDERFVTVSDYNDDGLEDLVTRIHPSGEIRFYQNTGASMEYDYSLYAQAYAFSAAFDECNNGQSNALSCFTDFDNDGVTDFLVYSANHYNCGSNAVRIYWGSATHPYFNDNDFTELAINGPYCVGAYSADLNNDGLADVLIRNCGPTNLYMNEGNRIFTQTDVFNTGRDINVIFDDYDLDGNVDLCYTKNGWADGQWGIRINFGNGDGTFNSSTVSAFDYLQPLDGFLNFNANPLDDNVPDIAFTCNGENNSKVYIGELNTDGFEGDFLAVDASDETRIVQAFDIDNNGFEDLIIRLKTGDNYSAKAYLNDGHGNFTYKTIPVLGNSPYYPYKFWREGERILMATYHGVDRDSIVVFELKAITCESLCATLVTLPYSENFDTYTISTTAATGVEPKCWELVQEDVEMTDANRPQLYYKSEFAHSGNYSLKLHNRGVYAMPPLDENMAMKHVHLEMYLRQPNAAYQLQVGVWDDETGTFEPITTFNNSTTGVEHVECDFSNYTGNGRRIAFRNTLGNGKTWSYSYNYLDDISLTETEG